MQPQPQPAMMRVPPGLQTTTAEQQPQASAPVPPQQPSASAPVPQLSLADSDTSENEGTGKKTAAEELREWAKMLRKQMAELQKMADTADAMAEDIEANLEATML